MFSLFRSRPAADLCAPAKEATAAQATAPAPVAAPQLDVQQRQQALAMLSEALRSGMAQLTDTDGALKTIVRNVAEADEVPLAGRAWELLARRLRADLSAQLSEQVRALADLQVANRHIQAAVDLMGVTATELQERTCELAHAAVRRHLSACAQRLTLIAQTVTAMSDVRLGLVAA